jgi:hypothetical protein
MRSACRIALAAALLLACAACTSSGGRTTASTPFDTLGTLVDSFPDDTTVPATAPAADTPAEPDLPTIQGGACPPVAAVPAPQQVTTDQADLDGDGAVDAVTTYFSSTGRWHLRASLAAGGGIDVDLAGPDDGTVAVLGGTDVDGQPGDEVLVSMGGGPTGTRVAMLRWTNCGLIRLSGPDGQPAAFPVGATETEAHGLRCTPGAVVVLDATSADGQHFDTTDTILNLGEGGFAPEGPAQTGQVDALAQRDQYLSYLELDCGDLQLLED